MKAIISLGEVLEFCTPLDEPKPPLVCKRYPDPPSIVLGLADIGKVKGGRLMGASIDTKGNICFRIGPFLSAPTPGLDMGYVW